MNIFVAYSLRKIGYNNLPAALRRLLAVGLPQVHAHAVLRISAFLMHSHLLNVVEYLHKNK